MSKRRHYSENFNSDDYPADVLTFLAKNWTTPKTEMQDNFRGHLKPKNYQNRKSHTDKFADEYTKDLNNDKYEFRYAFVPELKSEYMDQFQWRRESDFNFYNEPPDDVVRMAPVTYWNPDGRTRIPKCCCISKINTEMYDKQYKL